MIINGSLLCSVPIVKHFGRKFISPKMGRNFEVFWVFREKILTLTIRPLGNQSPPKHVIWRKNGVDRCKNVVSRGGQEILLKNKK